MKKKKKNQKKKLWGSRFSKPTHELVESFTESLSVDSQLALFDIAGSRAHVKMLGKCKILSQKEAKTLLGGLDKVEKDFLSGKWKPNPKLEDIHMNIETYLTKLVGEVGGKVHSARSRNDQVATATRLFLRHEVVSIILLIERVQSVLVKLAESYYGVVFSGYTHLQQAQPILFSHHLLAYVSMLDRDKSRFEDILERTDVLPLGAGAMAGTSLPIDREYVAKLLKFSKVSENSMDTVADRDDLIETASACAILGMHFSRMSEELVLWTSSEFNYIELDESFCTGSSIMPQKMNPDVAELTRGKTGRLYGNLMTLLTIMKGLPLAYNRDMQEDKGPIMDSIATVKAILEIFEQMMQGLKVNHDEVHLKLNDFALATDLAEYLVKKGMPFRQAHGVIGGLVSSTLLERKQLRDLTSADLKQASKLFGKEAKDLLSFRTSVEGKASLGGTSPKEVKKMISVWKKRLSKNKGKYNGKCLSGKK